MLQTVAIVLVVLWALGLLGGVAIGGLIHVLLIVAIVILVVRFASGRRLV